MLKQTGLCLWVGALAAAACGGPSDNDFSGPADAGSQSAGSSGSAGSKATGGAGGASAAAGRGGSGAVGSGGSTTGGSGGSALGGTGNGGSAGAPLGGSSGTPNETGGTGMSGGNETGGTASGMGGVAMGGTGNETGGTASGMGGRVGMAGKPGKGGSGGAEPSCDELAKAYSGTLTEAKVCNADSGKDQCTELVPSSLSCGCDQFVNPSNEEAVAELERLRKQAGTRCATVCPAIACLPPAQGTCEADGTDNGDGHCVTGGGILE